MTNSNSITKEQAQDLANDPLELIRLLSGDTAKRARNDAEIQDVTQQSRALHAAQLQPLTLTIPTDWDSPDRKSYAILHLGVDSVERAVPTKKPAKKHRLLTAADFGGPVGAAAAGVLKVNATADDWRAPKGNGLLSNVYSGVALQSKSTGQHYSVNILIGVSFIDPDLFDGEFSSAPLREAVEREMIVVLPPGAQFKIKMLSKAVRERMAIGACYACPDPGELRWYADLLPDTEIAKTLLRKAASLEE